MLQSPAPGTIVGPGATMITLTVSNSYGLTASCQTTVTVVDTTPPSIACAAPVVLSAGPACTALLPDLTAQLIVVDNCDFGITQSPPAGTVLPLGVTIVTLTATDSSNNVTNCMTTVTVIDTTPPAIACPANIAAQCTDTNGATVTFAATATDNCDANPVITCVPASGSVFPEGVTTVNCRAVDAAGNTNTCAFTVTVTDPVSPVLTIARSGSDVNIAWPQSCTRYVLEESLALGPTAAWTTVTAPVQTVGANYQVTVSAASGNKFYRLRKQP